MAQFCGDKQGPFKDQDSLKEKRHIAEDGKYILQRKLESMNAVYNQTNVEEIANFYKINSSLDLLYEIAIKKIDLKELKEFTVHGDKVIAPKIIKPVEEKNRNGRQQAFAKKKRCGTHHFW